MSIVNKNEKLGKVVLYLTDDGETVLDVQLDGDTKNLRGIGGV